MSIQKQYYQTLANQVIKNMEKRHMWACYVDTKEEAVQKVISLLQKGETISWGGSMTLDEIGLINVLKDSNDYTLLDRSTVNREDVDALYRKVFSSDTFLMSSNAITQDGKLVNIDGNGNRVAALIYGPKQVIVVAGMNKLTENEETALKRVHNVASPQNTLRLHKNTPCSQTGSCNDCLSPDCICCQTVITRNSKVPNRIKVILVGESLGY